MQIELSNHFLILENEVYIILRSKGLPGKKRDFSTFQATIK